MTSLRTLLAVAGFMLPIACSSSTTPPADSGQPPVDNAPIDATPADTTPVDVAPVDTTAPDVVVPREPQPIYSPCRNNSECMEGLTCDTETATGISGGICNRTCATDSDCLLDAFAGRTAVDGYCNTNPTTRARYCSRVCENGLDCERDGFTCQTLNAGRFNQVKVCIPVCTGTSCVDGNVCERESNLCRPTGYDMGPGRHIGDTCTAPNTSASMPSNQCYSGFCNPEAVPDSMMRPVPTGFNGGQCIGRCILPTGFNPSTIWPEAALPQSNCPTGSVCLFNGTLARGDLGVCLDECNTNADCRTNQGYYCRKSIRLSSGMTQTWTNGWCTLIDCANAATPCPTGYMCRTSTSGTTTTGRCIPATMM